MTSKIKVDNVNKVSDDSNIINKCGTTITLGASGDTVNLASGASQSGFGRSGSVNWQTASIKTTTFTAADGEGYFANTSGGTFTMNLPAGVVGTIVAVVDYTNSFQTHKLTVTPNGTDKIGGVNASADLNTEGESVTLVYVDGLEGWKTVQNSISTVTGQAYIVATVSGACNAITTSGDYKFATFKNPGTFCVSAGVGPLSAADYLVVAGGGGGGSEYNSSTAGGGAGGGGYRFSNVDALPSGGPGNCRAATSNVPISPGAYSIVVGGGGAASSSPGTAGTPGGVSTFSTITSTGGGGGGNTVGPCAQRAGQPGGSGGGGAHSNAGGTGNTPPVSPPQGTDGGTNVSPGPIGGYYLGAGGGGAMVQGQNGPGAPAPKPPGTTGGAGGAGAGLPSAQFGAVGQPCGSYYYFSGGGGGGGSSPPVPTPGPAGPGGVGGGGAGGAGGSNGTAGTALTGGGGGGSGNYGPSTSPAGPYGGAGGGGIVVIRYRFQ